MTMQFVKKSRCTLLSFDVILSNVFAKPCANALRTSERRQRPTHRQRRRRVRTCIERRWYASRHERFFRYHLLSLCHMVHILIEESQRYLYVIFSIVFYYIIRPTPFMVKNNIAHEKKIYIKIKKNKKKSVISTFGRFQA